MINLFQFQEAAAANIAAKVAEYLDNPASVTVNRKSHQVPFFNALSALTGSGKTVVLADGVSQIADLMPAKPLILWLSKGKVVVAQTLANLSPGGKYHHLLDNMRVQTLAEYTPEDVGSHDGPMVYFATVGTFNQKDKQNGSLKVHQSDLDVLGGTSMWEALRLRTDGNGNRRPLVIVYDEAQNLSDQQTELLLELEPDGFLLASATMRLPARIGEEVKHLRTAGYDDEDLITKIDASEVVAEGLVKDTVLLEGYNAPMEETVSQMLADMEATTGEAKDLGLDFTPKGIYVCNTNVVADTPSQLDSAKQPFNDRQAPPILIWRFLVEQMGVDPSTVAVYADLKTDKDHPLPDEFILFKGADKDFYEFTKGDYTHVIFNLTLQEGWDDPSVYFAYIDKSMGSTAQITQVIGRVLRQPGAQHYASERLNAAHFYVRVDKNAVFNEVIAEVKNELGEGSGGVHIVVSAPGKEKPKGIEPNGGHFVPETALDATGSVQPITKLLDGFPDFRESPANTKGAGSRRVLRQKVGESGSETAWEAFEQASTASARWVFQREVQRRFKQALHVVNLTEPKLDAIVGIGSPAYKQVCDLAEKVVQAYVRGLRLKQRKSNPYRVGSILVRPDEMVKFDHAVHEGYSGLNGLESPFAEAVDATGATWCRNPDRTGYGIPLVSVGPTSFFYPDFLIWTDERVVCIDTKGQHLVRETAARKLLNVAPSAEGPRLDIQFVSEGRYDDNLELKDPDGYTYWGLASDGTITATHYEDLAELVTYLLDDSLHMV